ncbi:hypothetical protein [Selenomonas ruminantium]|uniref:Uncharacterized protein n=1 Tax=Selenomonas ruminantium TaxID=971 RepID=A0A1I0V2W2_SELRU|nr:hypothetical protein [Selenomonas ruminantium]SDZ77093.1 hypothetical protein SAMN05660648_00489 [Selenomonas ruminantium]SFA70664.1 hypothetical protein SAMN05216587_101206 [Selenomonas ruminantium]
MDLDSVIRGKLGEAYAMSPWTEDKLDEMLQLISDYAEEQYNKGYQAALVDAQSVAQNVSYGAR